MNTKNIIKHYSNGEVTVVWQPHLCIHSTKCFKNLPTVFDPRKRPWVTPEGATTEQIVGQIKQCPSGALSHQIAESKTNQEEKLDVVVTEIELLNNGPLLVSGTIKIKDSVGNISEKEGVTALCRCGASCSKPFCDGSHVKIGFES